MSRYIDADVAKKAMQKLEDDDFELYGCDIPEGFHADRAIKVIDNIPIADVQAVKHGKWGKVTEPLGWQDVECASCSICGESYILDEEHDFDTTKELFNFCPNCGARMDGDEE